MGIIQTPYPSEKISMEGKERVRCGGERYLYVALLWNRLAERDSYPLIFVLPYGGVWKNSGISLQSGAQLMTVTGVWRSRIQSG